MTPHTFDGTPSVTLHEGTSHGEHQEGLWHAGVPEWGAGRWCDVFEIRDWQIQRCFIYLDRSLALSDSEHRPAGGRERSSAAWSGGHPRRPVAVFRHRAVAAAKPSGDLPSLARIRRADAQGVALTPGSVRSRWCHTCPSAHLRVFNA
jgi:hypothetical protein